VLALLALLGVMLGLTVALALSARRALSPPGDAGEAVAFEVKRGATLQSVSRDLERAGVVRSARAFEWLARWRSRAGELRAGEYELSRGFSAERVLAAITAGNVKTHELALPEGLTAVQVAERVEAAGLAGAAAFLAAVRDPEFAASLGVEGDTLEGYLFPETYQLARGLAPRAVVRTLVEHFLTVWAEIAPAAEARGLSMGEVVTLASIVEKETGAPSERPLIAAVFLNRLRLGMRLETDPTVIYGIADFDGNLTRAHLEDASNPYNTYRIVGLPPGPIANPGGAALRAVVEPAETEYLYFVSRNDGTHVFSRSYREHVNAVDRYQRRRAAQ
jgi:UPF0755 protein